MGSGLDAVVRGLMRDMGAALRPLGFRGSGGVWRLVTAEGAAVLQKQGSHGSTGEGVLFYLDTAVVPMVWWEWKKEADTPDRQGRRGRRDPRPGKPGGMHRSRPR